MALSNDVVTQFAKLLDNNDNKDEGTVVKGTYKKINNVEYVQIDGSDVLTPVETAVDAEDNERVQVLIKDHYAVVTANITSPAARSKSVADLKDEVDELGNTVQMMDNTIVAQGNSIILMENNINQQGNTINQHDNIIHEQNDRILSLNNTVIAQGNAIEATNNSVVAQGNVIDSMNNTVTEHGNNLNLLNNTVVAQGNRITQNYNTIVQQGNTITQQGNTINQQNNVITELDNTVRSQGNVIVAQGNVIDAQGNQLTLHNSEITILNSAFVIQNGVLTGLSQIILNELDADYAQIDFANINTASIKNLYATSGIIQNIQTQIIEGKEVYVSGDLMAVNISGSLVKAGTIVADRLVFRDENGLFKALNANGEINDVDQDETNSLMGNVIAAHSITADKMLVNDLSAFNATIGGFNIGQSNIHSTGKDTINSPDPGIFLASDGQMVIGDNHNHIKFYKDQDSNEYKLDVRLDKLYLGTSQQTADQQLMGLVELSANNITSVFRSTGGSNLIKNSVGFSNTDFWIYTGTISTYQSDSLSASGSEFILNGTSTLEQTYSTQLGVAYSVSFKYKHTATGNADYVKVELIGDGDTTITVLETNDINNEWVSVTLTDNDGNPITYNATTTTPKIRISCTANNTLEITDLIVSQGMNDVWSGYIDEVYGKEHKLDKNGLRLYSESSNNSSHMTSNSYLLKDGENIVGELSKDRVYSDSGIFNKKQKIGNLTTMVLDSNNIIEYVEGGA